MSDPPYQNIFPFLQGLHEPGSDCWSREYSMSFLHLTQAPVVENDSPGSQCS